jgi:predicted enzyme related to lactoylglutathione lyase
VSELRLSYANVFVTDLERAIDFYQNTLGLPLQFHDERFGFASFAPGGLRLGLARVEAGAAESQSLVGRHTGLGLGVRDLNATYQRLKARGVRFTMAPSKQPWGGFMAMLADPDGNIFYLDQIAEE